MKENDNKKIQSIVDELLAPTNKKGYNDILNKRITEEESLYMDSWIKFLEYERKERVVEEQLKRIIEDKDKPSGMRFEQPKENTEKTVDITKYEYKPITEEEQLEVDLLINKVDIENSKLISEEEDFLLSCVCVGLEDERDILVSEEIRNHLIERFHYFPVREKDIDDYYNEHNITLEIPTHGIFHSVYILKINNEVFKTIEMILNSEKTDKGLLFNYKVVTY